MNTLNIYRVTTTTGSTVYTIAETHSHAFAKVENARRSDFVKPYRRMAIMNTLNIYRVTTTTGSTVYTVAETHSHAFAKVENARRSDFVKPYNY